MKESTKLKSVKRPNKPASAKDLIGKRLLFVVAHPDDESFLASGLAHRNRIAGGKNCLVCATLGEKGRSHLRKPVTARQLKEIRRAELFKVAKHLKFDHLDFLNLPDGGLKEKKPALAAKILKAVQTRQPEFILSFDRDGISGHIDHIVIGAVAKAVARKLKIRFVSFCIPPALARNFRKSLMLNRKHGKYTGSIRHAEPDLIVKIDPKAKLKALACHASQLDDPDPRKTVWISKSAGQGLNYEYFKIY